MQPGMMPKLRPGQEITVLDPKPSGVYKDYRTSMLESIAAGLGPMFEQLTGNFERVTYSSFRGGHLSFWHIVEAYRWLVFIPMFLKPVWRRFIDAAYLAGRIPEPNYGVRWTAPKMPSVDPSKDAQATETRMSNGTLTWPEAVAEGGFDPEEQFEEIKRWNQDFDAAGAVFAFDLYGDRKSVV